MTCRFVVFRHLAPSTRDGFTMTGESVAPVLDHAGRPVTYDDERTAYAAAAAMNRENCRMGSDRVCNMTFEAGWLGERT